MFKRSRANTSNGESDDNSPALQADQPGHREADEGLAPDARSSTVPDHAVLERDAPGSAAPNGAVPDDAAPPKRPIPAGFDRRGHVRRTRAGAWWAGLIAAAILAIALLIFISQNSQDATINYLGFSGQISLAVALLSAAAGGMLLVAIPGAVRMAQLRRALKKNAADADKG
ncbi:lipopolysaccharide assembly protein LapA domain-containing protein [Aeromicrobium sp.]